MRLRILGGSLRATNVKRLARAWLVVARAGAARGPARDVDSVSPHEASSTAVATTAAAVQARPVDRFVRGLSVFTRT
jgi:hypothetical protein